MKRVLPIVLALMLGLSHFSFSQSYADKAVQLEWSAINSSTGDFEDFILRKEAEEAICSFYNDLNTLE